MPSYRSYWADSTGNEKIADAMVRNRFHKLRSYFQIADNSNCLPRSDPSYDKLFKIRPFLNGVKKIFRKIQYEEQSSFDGMIIHFEGRSRS